MFYDSTTLRKERKIGLFFFFPLSKFLQSNINMKSYFFSEILMLTSLPTSSYTSYIYHLATYTSTCLHFVNAWF